MKLQLGGNKTWKDWTNLDATAPVPFHFEEYNKFPVRSDSQDIVYSSHLLEHLPHNVVDYVLDECHRVLKQYSHLIIKIPDFDKVLANWKANNNKFFDQWGIGPETKTWKVFNTPDTIDYRCSMIFCGFWNKEYGDHFARKRKKNSKAYHGPVPMPEQELRDLLSGSSPHFISNKLREKAPEDAIFNHQTAWGSKVFENLLRKHNFFVDNKTEKDIIEEYSYIPDISNMRDISLYVSCYKI